jgi:hypothetical protein
LSSSSTVGVVDAAMDGPATVVVVLLAGTFDEK